MRLLVLLLLLLAAPVSAQVKDTLVIHSYHQGLSWTDSLQAGLESATKAYDIPLHVSYMDSKRYQSERYLNELLDIYRTKLTREKYRAIVVTDDHALWLVNQLSDEVGETPVLMVGINNYQPQKHSRLSQVTGVLDVTNPADNISLALSQQPDLQQIYVIADKTYTGQAMWQEIDDYLKANPSNLAVHRLSKGKFSDIFSQASLLPDHSAIIYLSYFLDSSGNYMGSRSFVEVLTEGASAPVYASYQYLLEHGVVGGVMGSGYEQGQQIGRLLVAIIHGDINQLPMFAHSAGKEMFNHQALQRWGLSVPEDVVVMNKPQTWFERYRKELRAMTVAVVIMGTIIVLLVLMIRRLRKSEQKLQQSQALFEGVFDQSFQYIGILDDSGVLISGNLALQSLVGRAIIKYDRPMWRWHCWEPDTTIQLSRAFSSAWQDKIVRFEVEIQSHDDGRRMLDIAMKRMPEWVGEADQLLFEARDVTSRHQMEEKLREREVSYRLLYEQQPVILLAVDAQARIQSVNQFAADLLGYSKRQMLGHKVTDFYFDDVPLPQQYISTVRESEKQKVWRRKLRYRCADGHTVWIRETIRPTQSKLQLLLVGEDISSTRELEAKLEYRACHDYLTDLFNRNYFEQQLETVLLEARDKGARHAMFYIDLDQFKVINDTAGHEAGDEALKQVALLLQGITPDKATLSRLGGDEFAIILRHCSPDEAVKFGSEVLRLLEDAEFYWQNTRFSFSGSIGIRLIDETAGSPQQVHAQADTACYAAKDEGRNRLHLYHPDDEELKRRELEMECVNLIRKALVEKRLELHAQQISPLSSQSRKQHYEILVRIRDSDGAMVSPGLFMPAAERYNLAHLIDRYVVNEVIDWLVAHPEAVEQLELCAINLSGQSMGNRDFVCFLVEKIRSSGLPTNKLCLEITETAAIGNMSEAIQLFTQLKFLGCLISLDDFGSGLSSFGYLKRMPVDIIKIDGMFVRDIAEDEMDFAMVKAINELAKKMGKQTVAEFVENEAILNRLRDLGVDYAQGYLFGKPQPLAELVSELCHASEFRQSSGAVV
ncbi:EAL domain-containing protein [Photobacterium sp. SDRW27]|uniref:ABC transporter substrate binding protein n=1 Tax=Photobacterium obscurum TaxID=2829490 RepID=UPI0022445BD5|nr:ABC transporter substrate binding protein [Photobacterium obscurum]MCW8331120.1 EAL domain-containing protein [Photobacterium obscurum]